MHTEGLRKFEANLKVKPSKYADWHFHLHKAGFVLFYESDDSHSFKNWNAKPPRDPKNYGVTLFLE